MKVHKEAKSQHKILPSPSKGMVEIWGSQDIKQSANYQSAGVTYGVKITCEDSPKAIQDAFDRVDDLIEGRLIPKIATHQKILRSLSK